MHTIQKISIALPIFCPTGEANGLPPKKDIFYRQMTIMWCNTPSNPKTRPTRHFYHIYNLCFYPTYLPYRWVRKC